MKSQSTRLGAVEDRISLAQRDLNYARREHTDQLARLVDSPDNANIQEQLRQLEGEIAQHERTIRNLESAKEEAARRDTTEFKRQHLESLKRQRADIDERATRMHAVALDIVAAIDTLHPLLAEFDALATDQHAAGWSIVRATAPVSRDNDIARYFDPIEPWLRGASARPAVAAALYAAGLGRVGLNLFPWVDVQRVEQPAPLDREMEKARARVAPVLDKLLADYEANLGV
jgi:uncharacterized membrane protein YccC